MSVVDDLRRNFCKPIPEEFYESLKVQIFELAGKDIHEIRIEFPRLPMKIGGFDIEFSVPPVWSQGLDTMENGNFIDLTKRWDEKYSQAVFLSELQDWGFQVRTKGKYGYSYEITIIW